MGKAHWLAQGLRQSSIQVEPSVVMTTQNFKRKAKKKSATCSFISSCCLETSGLPTKAIDTLKIPLLLSLPLTSQNSISEAVSLLGFP